jgi:hypothetical protein
MGGGFPDNFDATVHRILLLPVRPKRDLRSVGDVL